MPYHPQTSGLVGRFNQTLKSMLKKFFCERPEDWSKLLPYLLFADQEVLRASEGFSPFELLYALQPLGCATGYMGRLWQGTLHGCCLLCPAYENAGSADEDHGQRKLVPGSNTVKAVV